MLKKNQSSLKEIQAMLPKGWEILPEYYDEDSEYTIIKIRKDDLRKTSIRLVKYPPDVREYLRNKQRKYRAKLNNRAKNSGAQAQGKRIRR